jgi:RHS repeat-associated protein
MVSRPLVHSTTYAYATASGAMTNISYSDGTPSVSFAYDRLGRQTAITDATGTRTFTYNAALQLAAETNAFGVLVRAYDGLGRTAGFSLFNPANPVNPVQSIAYGYNSLGRFQSVSSSVFSVSSVVNYSYLPGTDLLSGWSSPTGHAVIRSFEPNRDLLTAVSNRYNGATVSAFDYLNDALGRRTARLDTGRAGPPDPPVTNRFGYNPRSELTSAAMGTNAYGYAYDPIGNRTAATNNVEALTYSANALNQYTNITAGSVVVPRYDLDGNLTNYNGWTFAWDGENRLTSAEQVGTAVPAVRFEYDYMSRRVQKAVGSTTNTFQYDGWAMIQEVVGNQTNSYIYGLDLSASLHGVGGIGGLLASSLAGTTAIYTYDANGNVGQLVSTSGDLLAHYEYSPFGETIVSTGPLAKANPFRFSTKYWDDLTGLGYWGYRYYHPGMGRWLSLDLIDFGPDLLLYAAFQNSPSYRFDLFGLASITHNPATKVPVPGPFGKSKALLGDYDGKLDPKVVGVVDPSCPSQCKCMFTVWPMEHSGEIIYRTDQSADGVNITILEETMHHTIAETVAYFVAAGSTTQRSCNYPSKQTKTECEAKAKSISTSISAHYGYHADTLNHKFDWSGKPKVTKEELKTLFKAILTQALDLQDKTDDWECPK